MRVIIPATLCFGLAACGAVEFDRNDLSKMYGPATNYRNPVAQRVMVKSFLPQVSVSRSGNAAHWTSPDGCTYSRTQAPGHAPVWYLVQNPHHVGMPNAHRGCAMTMVEG
ncbi:hypothetical protein [Leisingera thetidis]|uniref:hypothetical protein n=1 Tax=Leisingera thetidis TaxID=2930199 RepID=UPI0021F7AC72|nr:hypothetical protein [Leisingera thetidis]